jgi:hypothetical protein
MKEINSGHWLTKSRKLRSPMMGNLQGRDPEKQLPGFSPSMKAFTRYPGISVKLITKNSHHTYHQR